MIFPEYPKYYENEITGQLFASLAIIHSFSVRDICKRMHGEISLFWLKTKKKISYIFVPILQNILSKNHESNYLQTK